MSATIGFEPLSLFDAWPGFAARGFFERDDANPVRWVPAVDVEDVGNAYRLTVDVPGVDAKDIEINLEDGVLTLKGERKLSTAEEGKRLSFSERHSGSFLRRFRLPEAAVSGEVTAKLDKGVLEVRIAKPDKLQPRKIEVQS